jgi:dynein heavy chain
MGKKHKKGITRSTVEFKQEKDYLTPMDFIHLIRTDPEMADEFCYLNK